MNEQDIKLKTLTQIKAEIKNLSQEYDFDFCFENWKVERRKIKLNKNTNYSIGDLSIKACGQSGVGIYYKGKHFLYQDQYSLGVFKTIMKRIAQDEQLLLKLYKVENDRQALSEYELEELEREVDKYKIDHRIRDLQHRGKYLHEIESHISNTEKVIEREKKELARQKKYLKQCKIEQETLAI